MEVADARPRLGGQEWDEATMRDEGSGRGDRQFAYPRWFQALFCGVGALALGLAMCQALLAMQATRMAPAFSDAPLPAQWKSFAFGVLVIARTVPWAGAVVTAAVGVYAVRTGGFASLVLTDEGLVVRNRLGSRLLLYRDMAYLAPRVVLLRWFFGWIIPFQAAVIEARGPLRHWRRVVIYNRVSEFVGLLQALKAKTPVARHSAFL
jgi:hypothetical protein